jgi:hypothetical protein
MEGAAHSVKSVMDGGFARLVAALTLSALVVCACSRDTPSGGGATAEQCDRALPATGTQQWVSHPQKPSACFGVVMMCNYCEYDPDGAFEKSGSEACGVCIGADF